MIKDTIKDLLMVLLVWFCMVWINSFDPNHILEWGVVTIILAFSIRWMWIGFGFSKRDEDTP